MLWRGGGSKQQAEEDTAGHIVLKIVGCDATGARCTRSCLPLSQGTEDLGCQYLLTSAIFSKRSQ
jgi:hypothetical protein